MTEYLVTWEISLEADSPEEAVKEALTIQRDPDSIATIFQVHDEEAHETHRIDGVELE